MSPQSDDDVAAGAPATGRIEIVFSGGRWVSAGACDFGAGAAMVPVPLIPMS